MPYWPGLPPRLEAALLAAGAFLCLAVATTQGPGCATTGENDPLHPLAAQILVPRAGYTGLTNGAVKEGKLVITEYKFEDPEFRATTAQLHFICRMGKKRYTICADQPGLCRRSYAVKKKCFLGFCREVEEGALDEYLPASGYKLFLDANLVCYSEDKYNLQGW